MGPTAKSAVDYINLRKADNGFILDYYQPEPIEGNVNPDFPAVGGKSHTLVYETIEDALVKMRQVLEA